MQNFSNQFFFINQERIKFILLITVKKLIYFIILFSKGSRFGSGGVPLRAARSSVEGLNQEIEKLVLCPASGTQTPHLDRLRDKVRNV